MSQLSDWVLAEKLNPEAVSIFPVAVIIMTVLNYLRLINFCNFRWPAMGIHGDKSQQERDWVLNGEYFSN